MSFLKILEEARQKAREEIIQSKSVKTIDSTIDNIPNEQESPAVIKSDIPDVKSIMTIGDAIIEQSAKAVIGYKRLRGGTNASRRLAKSIASKHITSKQLQKAFDIQKRYNPKRPDWHIVGSYAMNSLKALLDDGIPLDKALNTPWKELKDE